MRVLGLESEIFRALHRPEAPMFPAFGVSGERGQGGGSAA